MSLEDGASEAPSLASGMSAYTDRTLGAATTTTASGSSRVPSTLGGRKANKPSRKQRRGKKGTGLRAGGPTVGCGGKLRARLTHHELERRTVSNS